MSQEVSRINNNFTEKDNITYPIIDAHMHIQGNQIAPIPIMKGVLLFKISVKLCESLLNGQINFQELSYLRNGEKYTYGIENEMSIVEFSSIVNNILNNKVNDLLNNNTCFLDWILLENRGNLLDLLGADKLDNLVHDYGKIGKFSSIDISKLYFKYTTDENKALQAYGYPSHKKSYTTFHSKNEKKDATEDFKLLAGKNSSNLFECVAKNYLSGSQVGKFQFSIVHGMELMYAHYWGAAGIPIYVFDNNGKLYYVTNSTKNKKFNVYDCADKNLKTYNIDLKKSQEKINQSNYIHFMKKINDEEVYQFEDHEQHVVMQKLAALKNPLNMLLFYHFDLRRFYAPLDSILTNHYFINYKSNTMYDTNEMYNQFISEDIKKYKRKKEKIYGFRLRQKFENIKNFFITQETVTEDSLFWGIKMYVALGYPPYYLLDIDLTKKIFPMLKDVDLETAHNAVKDFYKFCVEKQIPITCHGSPQGMTIADPVVYLKEYLKAYKDDNENNLMNEYLKLWNSKFYRPQDKVSLPDFPTIPQTYLSGLGLIDDFSSPKSWEKVLSYKGLDKLKLCIAHFGGSRFFDGTFKQMKGTDRALYQWNKDISDLIKKFPNVYTDISCFSFEVDEHLIKDVPWKEYAYERKSVKEIIKEIKKNVISANAPEDIFYRIYKTAENLADLLRTNEKLKFRIMFGTDWPMFETNEKMDKYKSNMFLVLQFVTAMLDNKWDAWHQFAVINPLLFLGLIEEGEKGFIFKENGKKKIQNYYESLKLYQNPFIIDSLINFCFLEESDERNNNKGILI